MTRRSFAGAVVVVTGAASGIGRAVAQAFAAAGADLALCDIEAAAIVELANDIRAAGRRVLHCAVDVSSSEQVAEFARRTQAELGPVDVLVNNAGVGMIGSFVEMSLADWRWIVSINLFGAIHNCHYFVPEMARRGGGHVINVSALAGFLPTRGMAGYTTTKHALMGFSESLRLELQPRRVRVTAVCPGMIKTGMVRAGRGCGPSTGQTTRERMEQLFQQRGYEPAVVADAIVGVVGRDAAVLPVTPEAWFLYLLRRAAPALGTRVSQLMSDQLGIGRDGSLR